MISSFGVHGDGTVEWQTGSEVGTVGFNLLRLDRATDRFVQVNDRLLPALIGSPKGGVYRLPDPIVVSGKTYTYELEEVEATGSIRRYGPFTVVAGAAHPTARALRALPLAAVAETTPRRSDGYTRRAHAANGRVAEPSAARHATLKAKAAAGNSNTSVRILVEQDGLYAVTADQIAAALGTSVQKVRNGIGRNQLRLQNRGQPVAWMADPGKDQLYFYGQAIDGTDSVYTRYNVYWLDQQDGLAMKVLEGKGPTPVANAQPFPSRIHAEEKTLPAIFPRHGPRCGLLVLELRGRGRSRFGRAEFPGAVGRRHPLWNRDSQRAYLQGATDLAPGNDHHAHLLGQRHRGRRRRVGRNRSADARRHLRCKSARRRRQQHRHGDG